MTRSSNLRPAPLFLHPSVVRAVLGDIAAIAQVARTGGTVQVPLLPIRLSDACPLPGNPEITRFETALAAPANDEQQSLSRPPAQESGLAGMAQRGDVSLHQQALADHREASPHPSNLQGEKSRKRKSRATGALAKAQAEREVRNRAFLAAYAAGGEVGVLGKQFGMSVTYVRELALRHGLTRKTGKQVSPQITARNAEVAKFYAAGMQIARLIESFGLSRANIYKIAEKAGASRPPKAAPAPKIARVCAPESAATCLSNADRAGRAVQAPEGSSGEVAGGASDDPANDCEQPTKPVPAAVVRPAAGTAPGLETPVRSDVDKLLARARAKAKAERAAEQAAAHERRIVRQSRKVAEDEAAISAFQAALTRVRARKADAVEVIAPKPATPQDEGKRLAAAFARQPAAKLESARIARPLQAAPGREECPRCGIPGWRGCAHFLPCEDQPVHPPSAAELHADGMGGPFRNTAKFTGTRRGIGASRL